jgi:hypothetical protein
MNSETCSPRSLWTWSPPPLAADTPAKALVDRLLRRGFGACLYFAGVAGLMAVAAHLPTRGALAMDGVAALAAATWCGLNFWRCRHAHCVVTSAGWVPLAVFDFTEALIGRSLIGGDEQLVFLAVLIASVAFEVLWYQVRGTNALVKAEGVTRLPA